MKKILCIIFSLSFFISKSASAGPIENEIIILIDSSGSVYDSTFSTWLSMLDVAEKIVSDTESSNTAHGIGIFSGNNSSYTVTETAVAGRMNMYWGLSPDAVDPFTNISISGSQNPGDVAGFVAGLDASNFLGGFSWYDAAMEMALQSFQGSSNSGVTNKSIVLLSDGGSPTTGHESVGPNGYISNTLQSLLDLDVSIASVVFDTSTPVDETYFNQLVTAPSNLVLAADFDFNAGSIVNTVAPSVPEPQSTLLISMGLLGLLISRRRRHF